MALVLFQGFMKCDLYYYSAFAHLCGDVSFALQVQAKAKRGWTAAADSNLPRSERSTDNAGFVSSSPQEAHDLLL